MTDKITMLHKKIGVPLARQLFERCLAYLKKHNPHSARTLPEGARAPVFLLHTGASLKGGGIDHIKPWLPLFERSGHEFIVVARMMDVYEQLRLDYPQLRVGLVKDSADVDTLIAAYPSLRGFYYVANTANNNLFLRCSGGRHVFLGHGDSDKSSSMNRGFKIYDEIYVAGQAHIDRFARAEFDTSGLRFRIIGRPDANALLDAADAATAAPPQRIVYIPTWEGYAAEQDYSSLALAPDLLRAAHAQGGLPIVAKLHPLTGAARPALLGVDQRIQSRAGLPAGALTFLDRRGKLTDLLAADAVFICDISATVSECLALDRPIFVYVPRDRSIRVVSSHMGHADYAYTFANAAELAEQLARVLGGDDPLAAARRRAREYFISPSATRAGAFARELQRVADGAWDAPRPAAGDVHCPACNSPAVESEMVACALPGMEQLAFRFLTCRDCGFVSNPDNRHDYLAEGFDGPSTPGESARTGDGLRPRREYRMAQMAADILERCVPGRRGELLVYGAGLSRDHALIAHDLPFRRIALCDMANFQQVEDFIAHDSRGETFDVVIASEVIEHFVDLEADFAHLFSKVRHDGVVVASTNLADGAPLQRLSYPFSLGHTAYHSGRSLQAVCRRFGMRVDFRTPANATRGAGPRKRYVLFYRDPQMGEAIAQYFADHHLAPSE
ncbi:MAG TPA: methyltransferase domain-containing protein [Stenotrophomonas sp.]|nr:methyltransferase domain-containing protein [Stenotrophomonas sp.]